MCCLRPFTLLYKQVLTVASQRIKPKYLTMHTNASKDQQRAAGVQGLKLRQEVRKVMVSGRGAAMLRQRLLLRHHGLMAALAGEHPAAPHACRLVKRWAAGQMLSWHLPEEMLELLVAAAFSRCAPPASRNSVTATVIMSWPQLSCHGHSYHVTATVTMSRPQLPCTHYVT